MITNFESLTQELSKDELKILPCLKMALKRHGKKNPVKANELVEIVNKILSTKKRKYIELTERRLRKYCNYIRTNGLLPLVATSKGYYISYDKIEIENQIKSLQERANSIANCAKGLNKFL